jgi:hypothetical protein
LGLDYGTNSCRGLIVDLDNGREVAQHVFDYPSGELGVLPRMSRASAPLPCTRMAPPLAVSGATPVCRTGCPA